VAIRCAASVGKVLLLTATSVYNSPRDIANLVAMVKGEREPLTKHKFDKIMADPKEFKKYFSCVFSFYDNPKDYENYPNMIEHFVNIQMSPSYYESYHAVEQMNSKLFESDPWPFLTGVRQASNALHECLKCKWTLRQAKKGEKMVIYSSFISYGLHKIQELFRKNGIDYVEITGKIKRKDRDHAVKMYNSNQVKILFITKAGGEGLELKGTRKVIIFESSWNRPNELQIIGRAVRYGSHTHVPVEERKVDVYYLIMVKPKTRPLDDTRPSADSILRQIIKDKETENVEFLKNLYPLSIENKKC
jgi:SNF2 family DNA or RNA helicase